MTTVAQTKVKLGRNSTDQADPALTALVDHLAAELAREYIRLMEDTAKKYPMLLNAMEHEKE